MINHIAFIQSGNGKVVLHISEVGIPALEIVAFNERNRRCSSAASVRYHFFFERYSAEADKDDIELVNLVNGFHGQVGCDMVEVLVPVGEGVMLHFGCHGCHSSIAVFNRLFFEHGLAVEAYECNRICVLCILCGDGQVGQHIVKVNVPT